MPFQGKENAHPWPGGTISGEDLTSHFFGEEGQKPEGDSAEEIGPKIRGKVKQKTDRQQGGPEG